MPLEWGEIKPTLRVAMPIGLSYRKYKKSDKKKWGEIQDLRDKLKNQLQDKAYHLCPRCLQISSNKILRLEDVNNKKERTV